MKRRTRHAYGFSLITHGIQGLSNGGILLCVVLVFGRGANDVFGNEIGRMKWRPPLMMTAVVAWY